MIVLPAWVAYPVAAVVGYVLAWMIHNATATDAVEEGDG